MFLLAASVLCCLVSGSVHTPTGVPVSGAAVTIDGPQTHATVSDADGRFTMQTEAGTYVLRSSRRGFAAVAVGPIDISRDTDVQVVLEPSNSGELRIIGSVTVNGRLARITSAIPSVVLTRSDMDRTGADRVSESLLDIPSLDIQYPHNGGSGGLQTVSLRGPDPSETMLTLDGQLLNDANTGDVDISQLPVAAFNSISVSEGLGPQDLEGSSTIGGAVNLLSLRPTLERHSAFSFSGGSFGQSEGWFNTTGTTGRLGYALALDDQQESGYVNETDSVCSTADYDFTNHACTQPLSPLHLGSATSQRTALANLRYTFSSSADIGARIFTMGNLRDQSASIAGTDGPGGTIVTSGPQVFGQSIRAYALNGRFSLGAGEVTADLSRSNDNVDINGGGVYDPMYDVSHADVRTNESLQWGRTLENASYSLGGYLRQETFTAPGLIPQLNQNIASYFARAQWQPARKLHLGAGAYLSHYTTFGSNLDGRLSAIYDTDPSTSVRFSVGTGFRAPLLIERYVFPIDQLAPDANGVYAGQGNPNEKPEHATEYELGVSHQFGSTATLDASFYRTNLRDPIENYYPDLNQPGPLFSYPINIGNAVYEGAELRYIQRVPSAHMYFTAQYGLNVAYPANMPATVSNPTSGANIVNNEQFANIPQQQASLEADYDYQGFHAAFEAVHRGNNNPLNQPPLTFLDAAVGHAIGEHVDLTLAGTNLLNAAAGNRFQILGGGQPYYGYVGNGQLGPIPTNALTVEPAGVRLILTVRR